MPDVHYAELFEDSARQWLKLSHKRQQDILAIPFVTRITAAKIYFVPGYSKADVEDRLERELKNVLSARRIHIQYHFSVESPSERLRQQLTQPSVFKSITFGSDVAERDEHLLDYFVSTAAFGHARNHKRSVIIGPKGSGKTAILRALASEAPSASIMITPEVFATSMLKQFVDDSGSVWDEDEAFVSTWIFTILLEVFKRVCQSPRGSQAKALAPIRKFLAENVDYRDVDLFTRFISYLKRIQAIKVGTHELTLKTRDLQKLYSLEPVYSLIPILRSAVMDDVLILIDELDQGWDNSPHANRFIASLLQAATRIQTLGLPVHVIAFIRSEIFDLAKSQIDQLDKLRGGIEVLRWKPPDLAAMVLKRVAHSVGIRGELGDLTALPQLFAQSVKDMAGFDYLVSRTTRRPREVLQFVGRAHEFSAEAGLSTIGREAILKAEEDFSQWKLEHLCAEYRYILPELSDVLWAFRGMGPVLSNTDVDSVIQRICSDTSEFPAWLQKSPVDIIQQLYSIEFLGSARPGNIKSTGGLLGRYEFANDRPSLNVKTVSSFIIHPAFWRALEMDSE
jgi:ribosomal protein S18